MTATVSAPVVEATDLRFRWRRREADVIAIDAFEVGTGERVFVEGPSGSGKTTLLNLIAAVLSPSAGRLSVLGQDVSGLSNARRDRFRSDHIGFVFQSFNLVPYLSLLENVLLACRFSPRRRERIRVMGSAPVEEAKRLLGKLGLDHRALDVRGVHRLSTGQQQRVAVARALIGRPELLICDEPTSALDADARDVFLDLLRQEAETAGATLIFVSHDRALAAGFDRTVQLQTINRAFAPVS